LAVALQAQKYAVRVSLASYFTGVNSLPLCEPSQKGCLAERPQLHHQ
jgi:hypothetical protein